jgi:ABC-type transport system involved in multi-copper enzyme maturation permease subunit
MRANLTRYALWQMRDFARERGIALLLVGTLVGFTIIAPVRALGREIDAGIAKTLLTTALAQIAFLLAFITLNGIVSTDRKQGYYRFLFSKPVSIPAYYAQLFVVYLVGFLVAMTILLGAFAIFAHPISPIAPLLYCGMLYLSMGGLAFLVSTLFRHDWSILAAILLASMVLHELWQYREGWRRLVLSILPPVYRLSGMLPDIMNKGTVNTEDVLWLLGYSAICFAAGILILRRRPFA